MFFYGIIMNLYYIYVVHYNTSTCEVKLKVMWHSVSCRFKLKSFLLGGRRSNLWSVAQKVNVLWQPKWPLYLLHFSLCITVSPWLTSSSLSPVPTQFLSCWLQDDVTFYVSVVAYAALVFFFNVAVNYLYKHSTFGYMGILLISFHTILEGLPTELNRQQLFLTILESHNSIYCILKFIHFKIDKSSSELLFNLAWLLVVDQI